VRVPAFVPVPLRTRSDGWTPQRQADFLGALAETRSVLAAARRVGMSRESAYRLRRREEAASFAASWDAALGRETDPRRKVTANERARRAMDGLLKPHFWQGKHVGNERKTDAYAILAHAAMLGRAEATRRARAEKSQRLSDEGVSYSTSPSSPQRQASR